MARKMFPNAEIMILVRNYNYEIVKNLPYIDRIIKIDDYSEKELENEIKGFNADIFIALYNDKIISKLARKSGASYRVGPISKIYSIFSFNRGVWQKRSHSIKNEAEYNLDLIRKIDPKRYDEVFEINSKIYLEQENIDVANMYIDKNKISGKILVVNPLENEIKSFNADIFIALYNDKIISKLARKSGASYRVGPISKIYSIFSFNKGVWQKRSHSIKNEAEYNLDLIRKIDPKRYDEVFEINSKIYLEQENIDVANMYIDKNKISGKILVVNPFMGGSAKTITDEQYQNLLQKIYDKREDISIIIACHISEKERAEKILKGIDREKIYVFANEGSVLNLAGIIDKATVYLGGSTGPTHLAGALGKNIVAIYPNKKTQHPIRWGVINNKNVKYIIPDRPERKVVENYSKEDKYFSSYDKLF